MNGYLVVLRHHLDDLPLLLTSALTEAREVAAAVTEEDGANEKKLLSIDASTPSCVGIYHFTHGRLTKWERVNDFE